MRNFDPRTRGHSTILTMYHFSTVDKNFRALIRRDWTGAYNKTTNTGNRWQGFTTKTKGSHFVQITRLSNLTGGMPFQGKKCLIGVHSHTVILDPQIRLPTVAKLDLDLLGTCIQTIFNQFFEHSYRTLDNFTRRYLVGYLVR